MRHLILPFLILFLIINTDSSGQSTFPPTPEEESYRIPFNEPGNSNKHRLSGTFGEPRDDAMRVHAGVDIGFKGITGHEMIGKKVYYHVDNELVTGYRDENNNFKFISEGAVIKPHTRAEGGGYILTFGHRSNPSESVYRFIHIEPRNDLRDVLSFYLGTVDVVIVDAKSVNNKAVQLGFNPPLNTNGYTEVEKSNGEIWITWPLRLSVGTIAQVANISEHLHFEDRTRDPLSTTGGFKNQIQDDANPIIHTLTFYEDGAETQATPNPFTSGDGSRQNPIETFGKTDIDVLADIVDHANGNTANKFMPKITKMETRCVETNHLVDKKIMEFSNFDQNFENQPVRTGVEFLFGPGTQIGGSGTQYKIWTSNNWDAKNGGRNSRIFGLEPGGLYMVKLVLTDHYGNSISKTVYLSTGRILSGTPDFENKNCFHSDGVLVEDELTVRDIGSKFVIPRDQNLRLKANAKLIIKSGGTLKVENGATVEMGKDAEIIIEEGANIESNSARFTSMDPLDSSQQFGKILIKSDYNTIKYTTFEGGTYNVWVSGDNNKFVASSFLKGTFGLRTSGANNLELEGITIKGNSGRGLHTWSSDIEMRETFIDSGPNSQTRIPSIVSNNGGIGIYLAGSSTLYMHGSASKNNGSSEIYIRENARLFAGDQQSDVNQGHNRISDNNSSGYYIYSLARTSDGETYQNWRVPARLNYWGSSSAPSSSRFFGNVDRSDHLDYDPAVMEIISDDTQCTEPPCPIQSSAAPQEMLTMNVSKSVAENAADPYEKRRMVESKQRLMDLRNEINKEPLDPHNAQRLKEAVYLARYIESSKPGSERRKSEQRIEKWRDRLITMANSGTNNFYSSSDLTALQDNKIASGNGMEKRMREHHAKVFMGETALIMELENAIYDGKYQHAKALIEENRGYINNTDNQASLWLFESILHEKNKEFGKALAVLQNVEQIEPEADIKENYVAPDFTAQKQLLRDSMRVYNQQVPVSSANRDLVTQEIDNDLPQSFELSPAFPNPFNPSTQVPFALPEAAEIRVEVYSITGRLVAVLANGRFDAGRHTLAFNAAGLASGVYLVRARLGEKIQTRKITLVK